MQHQVWACIGWAECQLRVGRTGEAARLLETALTLLAEHPDRAEQVRAYGLLAVVRLHRAEVTAAGAAAASAARLIAQFKRPTSFYLLEGYAGVAEVYLDQWEAGDRSLPTRRAARKACSALRTFARVFPIGEPRAQLWTGRLQYLSGRPDRAQRAWRASLSAAQRLGMPFEVALAHFELGRGANGQPQQQWHLGRAQTLLHELGVAYAPPSLHPPAR